MKFVYEKEGILVHVEDPKAEFGVYQHPKTVEDDLEVFSTFSRIPDAMIRKVDPVDPVLIAYLQTINPSIRLVCFWRRELLVLPKELRAQRSLYKLVHRSLILLLRRL